MFNNPPFFFEIIVDPTKNRWDDRDVFETELGLPLSFEDAAGIEVEKG